MHQHAVKHSPAIKKASSPQRAKVGNLAYSLDHLTAPLGQRIQRQSPPARQAAKPAVRKLSHAQRCKNRASYLSKTAMTQLYDVGQKLISLKSHRIFYPKKPLAKNSQDARVAATTEAYFNDSQLALLDVLIGRIYHMGNCLRDGKITFSCPVNDPHCQGVGAGGLTKAYVAQPYHINFCSTHLDLNTFIHEVAHAVLPNIGIKRKITANEKVIDRAYSQSRLFHYMSTHEALDNAESYASLVSDIYQNKTTKLTPPYADKTNCKDTRGAFRALATMEKWNHDASSMIENMLAYISKHRPPVWAKLPIKYRWKVMRLFPKHTSVAKLKELKKIFDQIQTAITSAQRVQCSSSRVRCRGGKLAYNRWGYVTASGLTWRRQRGARHILNVCPAWTQQNNDVKTEALFYAFMMALPSWHYQPLKAKDVAKLVQLAKSLSKLATPDPKTTNIYQHSLKDLQQQVKQGKNWKP